MKYSLRSLMIVVTLICVALGLIGARVAYLRRWAAFHKDKAEECLATINATYGEDGREPDDEYHVLVALMMRHTAFSAIYEYSAYHRPWAITDESDFEVPTLDSFRAFTQNQPTSQAPAPNPPNP
jgi:hypothetical protein